MALKALRINSTTYMVYRNLAAMQYGIILSLPEVGGSYIVVDTKTRRVVWFSPCDFLRAFKFTDVQDKMTLSPVKLTKFGKKMVKEDKRIWRSSKRKH